MALFTAVNPREVAATISAARKAPTAIEATAAAALQTLAGVSDEELLGEMEARGELTTTAETLPDKPSGVLTALMEKPWVREPALREGRELNVARVVNHEALLAQTRGVFPPDPCAHCQQGGGPFLDCVVVPGALNGSCAGCHYNSSGSRCSLRSGKSVYNILIKATT